MTERDKTFKEIERLLLEAAGDLTPEELEESDRIIKQGKELVIETLRSMGIPVFTENDLLHPDLENLIQGEG